MLRRPLTALTLTSEDVKAYEDRRQAAAFRSFVSDRGSSSQRAPVSDHTSDYEDYDSDEDEGLEDQEASYYPARYQNQQQSEDDAEIYRNEVDRSSNDNGEESPEEMEIDVDDERAPPTGLNPPAPRTGPPINRFGPAADVARAAQQQQQQGRRGAARGEAVTPTPAAGGGLQTRGGGGRGIVTPEAPARMTRNREERIGVGRGGRRGGAMG